jgi:hypothetical protein
MNANGRQLMRLLALRRMAGGAGALLLVSAVLVVTGVPAMASLTPVTDGPQFPEYGHPGGICPKGDDGWSEHLSPSESVVGAWGSAAGAKSSVSADVNEGYVIYVCTKAGPGRLIFKVTGEESIPTPEGKDLSHWSFKVKKVPDVTSTSVEDTTVSSTPSSSYPTDSSQGPGTTEGSTSTSDWSSTSVGPTVTSWEPTTSSSEPPPTTGTSAAPTSTETSVAPTSTETTEASTTTDSGVEPTVASTTPTSAATTEVSVSGIQVSVTNNPQVASTLPFTGMSSGSMAVVGAGMAALGGLLLVLSRKGEDRSAPRRWS